MDEVEVGMGLFPEQTWGNTTFQFFLPPNLLPLNTLPKAFVIGSITQNLLPPLPSS